MTNDITTNTPMELQTRDASSIILGQSWDRVQAFATMMARGHVTVPKHFAGNVADCLAISLQSIAWGMSPFAVAQKTFVTPAGQLGYEGQLVNAVIQASGALATDPSYEFIGDWNKVLGKFEKRQSQKGGADYYAATYTHEDEKGLGVIVRATLAGESTPRELTLMMVQARPRFSTQWATDPKQQICYLALRKFVRLHKPGVILGVYTRDEIDAPVEKHMGPAVVVDDAPVDTSPKPYPDAEFDEHFDRWADLIKSGKKTTDYITNYVRSRAATKGFALTAAQIKRLADVQVASAPAADPVSVEDAKVVGDAPSPAPAPVLTYAQVADAITAAKTTDALDRATDDVALVADAGQRQELTALAQKRAQQLEEATA